MISKYYQKIRKFFVGNKNSILGFTLIEMIIVVALMTIMSSIMIGYNRGSNNKLLLFSNQAKTIGVLERAKSFALQKRESAGGGLICAVGVHFIEPRTMIIFQDMAPPNVSICSSTLNPIYDNGEEIEEQKLDETIEFDFPESSSTVVFEPPYLNVYGAQTIILNIVDDTTATSGVTIGAGGQIYSD